MKSLTEDEAWSVIQAGKLGRLGCIDQGNPYVVPINYVVGDRLIYSHSLPGRKIQAMRRNKRACLLVDQIQNDFHWKSALAVGDYEEVDQEPERKKIIKQLLARLPALTPVESEMALTVEPESIVVFRLRIDRVTGMTEE